MKSKNVLLLAVLFLIASTSLFGYREITSAQYCTNAQKILTTTMYENIKKIDVNISIFRQVMLGLYQPLNSLTQGASKEEIFSSIRSTILKSSEGSNCNKPEIELNTVRKNPARAYIKDEANTLSISVEIIVSSDGQYAIVNSSRWRSDLGFLGLQRFYAPTEYFKEIHRYSDSTILDPQNLSSSLKEYISSSFALLKRPTQARDLGSP